MEHNLSNGKIIVFDPNEILPNPRTRSLKWLEERAENGRRRESEAVKGNLADYSSEGLYGFKDSLAELRQSVRYVRSPEAVHTRGYCKEMLRRINAELDRRGLPRTRPGDRRVYGPGQAQFQRAREVA